MASASSKGKVLKAKLIMCAFVIWTWIVCSTETTFRSTTLTNSFKETTPTASTSSTRSSTCQVENIVIYYMPCKSAIHTLPPREALRQMLEHLVSLCMIWANENCTLTGLRFLVQRRIFMPVLWTSSPDPPDTQCEFHHPPVCLTISEPSTDY